MAPLTGDGATFGMAMKRGLDLALGNIRSEDKNNKFALLYRDTELKGKTAAQRSIELVRVYKVQVIFGAAGSSVSYVLAKNFKSSNNKIILFSSISTADTLRNISPYFFRNIPPNSKQSEKLIDFITQRLQKRRVAVFYENGTYGNNMLNLFKEDSKIRVVATESYEAGQRNFRDALFRIKQHNPEVIFIAGTYKEISMILRQIKELEIDADLISGDGAYSPALVRVAGEAAEGLYISLIKIPSNSEEGRFFRESYRKKYEEDPNIYSALSYDAMNIIYKTIKAVGYDADKIREYLLTHSFKGIFGEVRFNENGEVDMPYQMYVVKNGKFELCE